MRIVMKVTVEDGTTTLEAGQAVETADDVAADFIARGYAEPESIETRKAAASTKKAASS